MKRWNTSFTATTTRTVVSGPRFCVDRSFSNTSRAKSIPSAEPQKFFFFHLIPKPKANNVLQKLKRFVDDQICVLQLHHPAVMTKEQQQKVYRSKIVPGAKVIWKDEGKMNYHLWLVEGIDNNNVKISQILKRGDIPSGANNVKTVSIDRLSGGCLKDTTIPLTMPEKRLAERVKLLYPTHINSLKFFCKNWNVSSVLASEMRWRDETDNTQVQVRISPVEEDIVDPTQGELVTGVRGLMTIIVDGERIPVFVNQQHALTLAEGKKHFFQRAAITLLTIVLILMLFFIVVVPVNNPQ